MKPPGKRGIALWAVQAPEWLLVAYLIVAQGMTAFGYDLGVALGAQGSARTITEVGVAFWYGFAFGDLLTYTPILLLGLIAHLRRTRTSSDLQKPIRIPMDSLPILGSAA